MNDRLLRIIQGATVILASVGFIVNFFATTASQPTPAPRPQLVPTLSQTAAGSEMVAGLLYQKKIAVEANSSASLQLTLEVRRLAPMTNLGVRLTAPDGEQNLLIDRPPTSRSVGQDSETWTWNLTAQHDGQVRKVTKNLSILVTYDLTGEKPTLNKSLTVPFSVEVDNKDFPFWSYFLAIASGVIISYVLVEGGKVRTRLTENFGGNIGKPVGWLVLSLLLVPALYMQYRQTVTQFDIAWINLIAAAPFGAGVDFAIGKAAAARA